MLLGNNLNMGKLELQNARIQNLASAPSSPVEGQIYFDTVLHQFGCFSNSVWVYLGASVSNAITRAVAAGAANELIVAGGADRSAQAFTTNGLLKIAAGIVASAVVGTDYLTGSSTNILTNKTFDAQGTGNSLANVILSMFAANVADTDTTLAANSDLRFATQKAIKAYVDAVSQGLAWKAPARAATTVNGTLATAYANGSVIDGVTLVTGDRILLKNQTSGSENGLYLVAASGAPSRTLDATTGTQLAQMVVDIREGSANADLAFVLTNDGAITPGTTALVYVDFVKAAVPTATSTVAGKVTLATLSQAEAKTDTSNAVVSADLVNFPIKRTFTIGDGSTTAITCTHNLGTQDVIVSVRDASTNAAILVDWTATSTSVVTVNFAVAPASNAYKVVIIG